MAYEDAEDETTTTPYVLNKQAAAAAAAAAGPKRNGTVAAADSQKRQRRKGGDGGDDDNDDDENDNDDDDDKTDDDEKSADQRAEAPSITSSSTGVAVHPDKQHRYDRLVSYVRFVDDLMGTVWFVTISQEGSHSEAKWISQAECVGPRSYDSSGIRSGYCFE
jgi:hypothetical protein